MRTSKLTRAATVAAIAATAGLAIAGAANAATKPAPAKAPATTLKAAEAKGVITGTLREGKVALAKESVTLESVAGKKATVVAKAVTSKAGVVTFKVAPKATTVYELVFAGTKALSASHSADLTVKVTATVKK
jgi:hypothetical protein